MSESNRLRSQQPCGGGDCYGGRRDLSARRQTSKAEIVSAKRELDGGAAKLLGVVLSQQ